MEFELSPLSNLSAFDHYRDALSSPIDSFLEDHILESTFHKIYLDNQRHREAGWFALHAGKLLTQFHLIGPARRHGQAVYQAILAQFKPEAAFVPTCDEFFLSHALDNYAELKKQAHFFVEGDPSSVGPALDGEVSYRRAELSDVAEIGALSGDFIDRHAERIQQAQLYVGFNQSDLVALGVIESSKLFDKQASIGMFTHAAYRGRGVGRNTLRYLRGVCRAQGVRPIAGCWYYNHASKRTLEAAGMVTGTRLLRVEYLDPVQRHDDVQETVVAD